MSGNFVFWAAYYFIDSLLIILIDQIYLIILDVIIGKSAAVQPTP